MINLLHPNPIHLIIYPDPRLLQYPLTLLSGNSLVEFKVRDNVMGLPVDDIVGFSAQSLCKTLSRAADVAADGQAHAGEADFFDVVGAFYNILRGGGYSRVVVGRGTTESTEITEVKFGGGYCSRPGSTPTSIIQ